MKRSSPSEANSRSAGQEAPSRLLHLLLPLRTPLSFCMHFLHARSIMEQFTF
jgi:hypothetical protein